MKQLARKGLMSAAAAALATTLVATPANAEVTRVDDGADATASLTDIRVVRAKHSDTHVKLRVNFPDLRKNASASMNIYIDTDRTKRGPEYVLVTPLFSGSDYSLRRMKNWKVVGDMPVNCRYRMTYKWRRDYVALSARRGCFGKPDEVRIGLRMRDTADASHPVVDWLNGRRLFTTWLVDGPVVA